MKTIIRSKKSFRDICLRILPFIIFITICIFLFLGLSGTTSTTQKTVSQINSESLRCEKSNLDYPFFKYFEANTSMTSVNIIFANNNLSSISLSYIQDYSNNDGPVNSNNINHAAMNLSFYEYGFGTDEFNANYHVMDKRFKMTLYAMSSELQDEKSHPFFLIKTSDLSFDILKNNYETQGFACLTQK